jgi:hypothetical protein
MLNNEHVSLRVFISYYKAVICNKEVKMRAEVEAFVHEIEECLVLLRRRL